MSDEEILARGAEAVGKLEEMLGTVKQAVRLGLDACDVATTPLARDRQAVLKARIALREALRLLEGEGGR